MLTGREMQARRTRINKPDRMVSRARVRDMIGQKGYSLTDCASLAARAYGGVPDTWLKTLKTDRGAQMDAFRADQYLTVIGAHISDICDVRVHATTHQTLRALRNVWDQSDTWEQKGRRLFLGAHFASVSMRTKTDVAEQIWTSWYEAGEPDTMEEVPDKSDIPGGAPDMSGSPVYFSRARNARLAFLRSFCTDHDRMSVLERLPTGVREAFFASECREWFEAHDLSPREGYVPFGAAKSAFALACAGLGDVGCIDSRILAKRAEDLKAGGFVTKGAGAPRWYQSGRSRRERDDLYIAATQHLWGETDTADAQWCEWDESGIAHRILLRR